MSSFTLSSSSAASRAGHATTAPSSTSSSAITSQAGHPSTLSSYSYTTTTPTISISQAGHASTSSSSSLHNIPVPPTATSSDSSMDTAGPTDSSGPSIPTSAPGIPPFIHSFTSDMVQDLHTLCHHLQMAQQSLTSLQAKAGALGLPGVLEYLADPPAVRRLLLPPATSPSAPVSSDPILQVRTPSPDFVPPPGMKPVSAVTAPSEAPSEAGTGTPAAALGAALGALTPPAPSPLASPITSTPATVRRVSAPLPPPDLARKRPMSEGNSGQNKSPRVSPHDGTRPKKRSPHKAKVSSSADTRSVHISSRAAAPAPVASVASGVPSSLARLHALARSRIAKPKSPRVQSASSSKPSSSIRQQSDQFEDAPEPPSTIVQEGNSCIPVRCSVSSGEEDALLGPPASLGGPPPYCSPYSSSSSSSGSSSYSSYSSSSSSTPLKTPANSSATQSKLADAASDAPSSQAAVKPPVSSASSSTGDGLLPTPPPSDSPLISDRQGRLVPRLPPSSKRCPAPDCTFSGDKLLRHAVAQHLPWFLKPDSACWLCGKNFFQGKNLRAHLNDEHGPGSSIPSHASLRSPYLECMQHFFVILAERLLLPDTSISSLFDLVRSWQSRRILALPPGLQLNQEDCATFCRLLGLPIPPEGFSMYPMNSPACLLQWRISLSLVSMFPNEIDRAYLFVPPISAPTVFSSGAPPANRSTSDSCVSSQAPPDESGTYAQAAAANDGYSGRTEYRPDRSTVKAPVLKVQASPGPTGVAAYNTHNALTDAHFHLDLMARHANVKAQNGVVPFNEFRKRARVTPGEKSIPLGAAVSCTLLSHPGQTITSTDSHLVHHMVGVHPVSVKGLSPSNLDKILDRLVALLYRDNVVALGEVGLDFFRDRNPFYQEQQALFLNRVLALVYKGGRNLSIPLALHVRDGCIRTFPASKRCLDILRQHDPHGRLKVYRHFFCGSLEEAQMWLKVYPSMVFGVGPGVLKSHNESHCRVVFRSLPLRSLLVESDGGAASFPDQADAADNGPFHVSRLFRWLGEVRSEPLGQIIDEVADNFRRFYGIAVSRP